MLKINSGVFERMLSMYGVIEAQGRGSLHLHAILMALFRAEIIQQWAHDQDVHSCKYLFLCVLCVRILQNYYYDYKKFDACLIIDLSHVHAVFDATFRKHVCDTLDSIVSATIDINFNK